MRFFKRKPGEKDRNEAWKLVEGGRKELKRNLHDAIQFFDKALKKDQESRDALEGKAFALLRLLWLQRGMTISYPGALVPGRTAIRLDARSSLKAGERLFRDVVSIAEKELKLDPKAAFALRLGAFAYAFWGLWHEDLGRLNEAKVLYAKAEALCRKELELDKHSAFLGGVFDRDPPVGVEAHVGKVRNILEAALNELEPK